MIVLDFDILKCGLLDGSFRQLLPPEPPSAVASGAELGVELVRL